MGAQKCAKLSQRPPETEPKSKKSPPEAAQAEPDEPADLHETCTGMVRLHVHTPLESSIFAHFGPKSNPKACWEGARKTTPEKTRKRCEKVRKTMPQDTQNGTQGHHKSLQILTRERSGGKEVPREASGYPLGRKRAARTTIFHQKSQKS